MHTVALLMLCFLGFFAKRKCTRVILHLSVFILDFLKTCSDLLVFTLLTLSVDGKNRSFELLFWICNSVWKLLKMLLLSKHFFKNLLFQCTLYLFRIFRKLCDFQSLFHVIFISFEDQPETGMVSSSFQSSTTSVWSWFSRRFQDCFGRFTQSPSTFKQFHHTSFTIINFRFSEMLVGSNNTVFHYIFAV